MKGIDKVTLLSNGDGTYNCMIETKLPDGKWINVIYPKAMIDLKLDVMEDNKNYGTYIREEG